MSKARELKFTEQKAFWLFAGLSLLAFALSIILSNPIPMTVPFGILFLAGAVLNPKYIIYLFFAILPFSVEIQFGSLGTDLPSEPLMLFLMGICLVLFVTRSHTLAKSFFIHPVSLIFGLHLCWIFFTSLFSTVPLFSFKYFLAKLWYVLPFFYLPLLVMKEESGFKRIFQFLSLGLFLAITYVMLRHAAAGFSFASSNVVMRPIFRNHVNYAIMLVAFLPFFWYLIRRNLKSFPIIKLGLLLYLLLAIYFSYTRAAQASVLLAIAFYFVIRWRLVKLGIGVTLICATMLVMHLSSDNGYLDYAPEFSKTVAHKKFDNLVEATTKMQDISTVERFYRWIAGAYMVAEKPLLGFGPSTFYTNYDGYTVSSYVTYVSDNPEKSGMHNNYMMVAVEQGIPGLLIMLLVAFFPLLYAENLYHRMEQGNERMLVLAAATCYFLIDVTILINELIEVDKIGPLYFLSASIIVFFDVKNRATKE